MGLLNKFLKSKETHCIEKYCDDGEPCLECTQGNTVRMIKTDKIKELLHLSNSECTLKDDDNGDSYFEFKDGDNINVFKAEDIQEYVGKDKE